MIDAQDLLTVSSELGPLTIVFHDQSVWGDFRAEYAGLVHEQEDGSLSGFGMTFRLDPK